MKTSRFAPVLIALAVFGIVELVLNIKGRAIKASTQNTEGP